MKEKEEKAKTYKLLSIDNLLSRVGNKFLLANALSGRAKQISEGSLPYVSDFDPTNPIFTALKEIAGDKIRIKVLKTPPKEVPVEERRREREEISILEDLGKKKKKKYK